MYKTTGSKVRHSLLAAACAASFAASARAQTHNWHVVFAGDMRDVFVWTDPADPSSHRVWICEDGARIRYWDSTSASWAFQTTPNSATQALLDIYVRAGTDGWACGMGGTVLHDSTTSGTWSALATVRDTTVTPSVPAVLWGIRFATAGDGYICGDHLLRWTDNTGANWHAATVSSVSDLSKAKFYAVEIVPGSSLQLVVGVEIEDDVNPQASQMLYSNDGKTWSTAAILDVNGSPTQLSVEFDTWDVVFEPNTGGVSSAVGYMVGGVGLHDGHIFRTQDGGLRWREEVTSPANIETMYAAHAWTGEALAAGYDGQIYKRDASTGVWNQIYPPGPADPCNANGPFTSPWNGLAGDNAGNIWAVGAFGRLCTSPDGGQTLTQDIFNGGQMWRLKGSYLRSATEGWMVGEVGVHYMDLTAQPQSQWTTELCTWHQTFFKGLALKSSSAGDEGWAVGAPHGTSDPAIWHRSTAGSWTIETSGVPMDASLLAVALLPSGGAVAVGFGGLVLRRDPASATWTQIAAPDGGAPTLVGVAAAPSGIVYLVGSEPNGSTTVAKAFRSPSNFETISPTSPGWIDVSPSSGASLSAVALRSMTSFDVYACGDHGTIVKWIHAADQFQPVSGIPSQTSDYHGISLVPNSSEIWVGGDFGAMAHFDGSSWSTVNCHTSKSIHGMSFLDSINGFALGGQNVTNAEGSNGDALVIKFY